jgi:hypothetical protein
MVIKEGSTKEYAVYIKLPEASQINPNAERSGLICWAASSEYPNRVKIRSVTWFEKKRLPRSLVLEVAKPPWSVAATN